MKTGFIETGLRWCAETGFTIAQTGFAHHIQTGFPACKTGFPTCKTGFKIYLKSILNLSKIYLKSIQNLANIYFKSI